MKKFLKFGCLGFIGIFVLLLIIGMLADGDTEEAGTTETTPTESAETTNKAEEKKAEEKKAEEKKAEEKKAEEKKAAKLKKEKKIPSIGDVIKVGDVEFTANGTKTSKNVGGEYGQKSKGTYLLVDVTVKNNGSDVMTVDSSFFKLKAGDKEYASDGTASVYANENANFFLEQLNPDLSLTGIVVFDVSEELIKNPDLILNVQSGLFGTEQGQIKIGK